MNVRVRRRLDRPAARLDSEAHHLGIAILNSATEDPKEVVRIEPLLTRHREVVWRMPPRED